MGTASSGSNIWTTGLVQLQDLIDICNHYRQWFGITYSGSNTGRTVTAESWNDLRNAILTAAGSAWSLPNFPGTFTAGQNIYATTWGGATQNFTAYTSTYTANWSGTIPNGCNSIYINQCVGGGGAGDNITNYSTTQRAYGEGGSSGGFTAGISAGCSAGQAISVTIGVGGSSGNSDGTNYYLATDSTVVLNGNTITTAGAGYEGSTYYNGSTNVVGAPAGGNSTTTQTGAGSPYGGYGAGGEGGGAAPAVYVDGPRPRTVPGFGKGANGGNGFVSITFNP